MGHSMLRRGRYSAPGQHYLVTIATADRCPLFADFFNGRVVARAIRELHDSGSVNSVAWVIMPEHLPWIFSLNERPLSVAVPLLKGRSARRINMREIAKGPVWQRAYHDHALRADESLAATILYRLENPLRAGLARRIDDYSLWDAPGIP